MRNHNPSIFVAGLLASLLPLAAQAKIEHRVEKTFAVQPGVVLRVATQGGNVHVQTGPDHAIHVVAIERIKADSEEEAAGILKQLDLTLAQTGNTVVAAAKYNGKHGWFHFGAAPVQVSFEVTVPTRCHADLRTSGGNIVTGNLTGDVDARTSGGNVRLGRIDGNVNARTSGGSVYLAAANGYATLHTSGGDIAVERVKGSTEATTSGGSIRIAGAAGPVHASTSGGSVSAVLVGSVMSDSTLRTSGGSVKVTLDSGAAFDLDAATSGGRVRASGLALPIDLNHVRRNKLQAAVNGGGPTLRLRSSGGDVSIVVPTGNVAAGGSPKAKI